MAGTLEVLRLACRSRRKPIHFVSTVSVFPGTAPAGAVFAEDDDLAAAEGLADGYAQSKWVAERLMLQAAARGLPVTVYRPGRITGDSRTGVCQVDDFFYRLVRGCLQLGAAPDQDARLDLTPVDFVGKALVRLSLAAPTTRRSTISSTRTHSRCASW